MVFDAMRGIGIWSVICCHRAEPLRTLTGASRRERLSACPPG
jgi:fucose 4-O-acetylase-like acetyltransferase